MDSPRFDVAELFDEDYLYFYEDLVGPERTQADVERIWRLLELEPSLELLDLACGHGRIANALAERGVRVTGLDATELFLERAREDAARRGVQVDYVEGDMRSLAWTDRFDRVVNWFTSFGYFEDEGNRAVLAEAHRALRPGGLLAVEMPNRDWVLRRFQEFGVRERDGDFMIDHHRFDASTGRLDAERIAVRGGSVRRFEYFVRLYTAAELRSELRAVGFRSAEAFGEDGEPLSLEHRRMAVVARK